LFQILGLKIIEADDNQLTSDDIFKYAEVFKIILENKNKMKSSLYQFIIKRLIDNVLLASMPIVLINKQYFMKYFSETIYFILAYNMPKLFNINVMKAYHPYLAEKLYAVSMIICERNIHVLSEKTNSYKAIISEKITDWIKYFIENDFLTIDELTNQIMSILRLSWPEVI